MDHAHLTIQAIRILEIDSTIHDSTVSWLGIRVNYLSRMAMSRRATGAEKHPKWVCGSSSWRHEMFARPKSTQSSAFLGPTFMPATHHISYSLSIPISLPFPLNGLESRSWFMVSWPHFLQWEALLVKVGVKHEEGLVQQWPWGCRVVPACKPWASSHLNLTNT